MSIGILVSLPIIAAIIGYATNYLAVKMLFHPREPKNFLFFKVQGIFPKRQDVLAQRLGNVVARELVSVDTISEKIKAAAQSDRVDQSLDEYLDRAIREKLPAMFPMMAMFLNDEMIGKIKGVFKEELKQMSGKFAESISEDIEQNLDIAGMVREKVNQFSSDQLEGILFEIMKKEFQFIEILGGVLGFIIGLVQALIVYFGSGL